METYYGHINTVGDALKLIEAVRFGLLPLIQRRLNANERSCIRSGSVFIFDASKSGVQRWTDGFRWSASRLHGHFLTYHQKEAAGDFHPLRKLIKRALSVVTADNRRFGLISYYTDYDVECGVLRPPSADPRLANIEIPNDYFFRRVTQLTPTEQSFLLTPLTDQPSKPRSNSPPSSSSLHSYNPSLPHFPLFPPMALSDDPCPRPFPTEDQRQLNAINAFF